MLRVQLLRTVEPAFQVERNKHGGYAPFLNAPFDDVWAQLVKKFEESDIVWDAQKNEYVIKGGGPPVHYP